MSYTPQWGSSVDVMLDALQRVDGMTSAELAAAGGVRTKAISGLMACAVKAGLVDRATEDKRVRYRWRGARTVAEAAPTIAWPFSSVPVKAAGGEAEPLPAAREEVPPAERAFRDRVARTKAVWELMDGAVPVELVDKTTPPDGGQAEPLPAAHEDDPPAEFAIALWDDGELDIFGGGTFEQHGVPGMRLNRDQVARLRGLLNCAPHPSSVVGPGLPELVMPGWSRRAGFSPTRENGHQE